MYRYTHTDTTDTVHEGTVPTEDNMHAAKRDVATRLWRLNAAYGPVKLVGRSGVYVVTATHGRQTFGTVTVERVTAPDEAPTEYATMSVDVRGNHLAGAPWRQYRAGSPAEAAMLRTRTTEMTHYVSTVAMPNGRTLVVLAPITTGTIQRVIVMVADDNASPEAAPENAPETLSGPVCAACNGDATCVAHDAHHGVVSFARAPVVYTEHAPEDIPAPTFPWPTGPADGDYTGGRPLPDLGDVVMTHRWRGGVRDVEASPATVVAPNTEDSRIVRFADGKEQAAFGYDMEPTGARVVEANGRTFDVVPCGRREWTVTERGGNGASGLITDQGPRFEYAVDLSGVEGWANNGLASAVREFAAETRMVHATRAQRNVAAGYASPGAIGRVLAELATTGTARLDLLSDDVRRTIGSLAMPERPAAAVELHAILTDVR